MSFVRFTIPQVNLDPQAQVCVAFVLIYVYLGKILVKFGDHVFINIAKI